MATEKRTFILRLPQHLYEKTQYLAHLEHRSLNMEIIQALEFYIADYEAKHGDLQVPSLTEDSANQSST